MSWSLFAREYERTCQDCGYSWRVPRSIARRGIRGIAAVDVMGATREGGFGQPGGPGLSDLKRGIAARSRPAPPSRGRGAPRARRCAVWPGEAASHDARHRPA